MEYEKEAMCLLIIISSLSEIPFQLMFTWYIERFVYQISHFCCMCNSHHKLYLRVLDWLYNLMIEFQRNTYSELAILGLFSGNIEELSVWLIYDDTRMVIVEEFFVVYYRYFLFRFGFSPSAMHHVFYRLLILVTVCIHGIFNIIYLIYVRQKLVRHDICFRTTDRISLSRQAQNRKDGLWHEWQKDIHV